MMPVDKIIYSGSVGLNNRTVPHRLPFSSETGVAALEVARDVIIDRTGQIVSRRGLVAGPAGSFHSIFPGKDWGLCAGDRGDPHNDTAIYKVHVSGDGEISIEGIWAGLVRGRKIDFCGTADGTVFYVNGAQNGIITKDGIRESWTESAWPDEDSIGQFSAPPKNAEHLGYNAGRMFFSVVDSGKYMIAYTEYGMLGTYDIARNAEQLPSRIILIESVEDGIYVSTERHIFFLAGLDPSAWTCRKVTEYPAIEWGKNQTVVDPSFLGLETQVPSKVIATTQGPLLLLPSGQVFNLANKNILFPKCTGGGAIFVADETLIIQTGEE